MPFALAENLPVTPGEGEGRETEPQDTEENHEIWYRLLRMQATGRHFACGFQASDVLIDPTPPTA